MITLTVFSLVTHQDDRGFIAIPADEYYGVPGDASLIGHAISIRVYAWVLTGDPRYLDAARQSARFLAERQDEHGGWHGDAGYALDAAQCVMEGFCTYERLTGDRQFHDTLVRAVDRMLASRTSMKLPVVPDGSEHRSPAPVGSRSPARQCGCLHAKPIVLSPFTVAHT